MITIVTMTNNSSGLAKNPSFTRWYGRKNEKLNDERKASGMA